MNESQFLAAMREIDAKLQMARACHYAASDRDDSGIAKRNSIMACKMSLEQAGDAINHLLRKFEGGL